MSEAASGEALRQEILALAKTNNAAAVAKVKEELFKSRQAGEVVKETYLQFAAAEVYLSGNDVASALNQGIRARAGFIRSQDVTMELQLLLCVLVDAYLKQGLVQKAAEAAEEALQKAQTLNNPEFVTRSWLAVANAELAQTTSAAGKNPLVAAAKALEGFKALKDLSGQGNALICMARVRLARNQYTAAAADADAAKRAFRESSSAPAVVQALSLQVEALLKVGTKALEATKLCEEQYSLFKEVQELEGEALMILPYAKALMSAGQSTYASTLTSDALQKFESLGNQRLQRMVVRAQEFIRTKSEIEQSTKERYILPPASIIEVGKATLGVESAAAYRNEGGPQYGPRFRTIDTSFVRELNGNVLASYSALRVKAPETNEWETTVLVNTSMLEGTVHNNRVMEERMGR